MFVVLLYCTERNWGENMKKFSEKLRSFFSKKPVMVVLVIFVLIVVAIAIYFFFIYDDNSEIVYEDYTIASGHVGKIEKYDASYTVDGYNGDTHKAYYITGNITAEEDKDFTVITFNLYDKDDNLLGTAVGGLNEVKRGKTYSFKALSLVENKDVVKIDHYKIKSIELGNN